MKVLVQLMVFQSIFSFLYLPAVLASDNPLVRGTVVDVEDKPVQGAYLFFYDSPDTKRAVDLVSTVTDNEGSCAKAVPPGKYWVLARLKADNRFDMGPLMIADKFSGDPLEIEVVKGEQLDLKFVVMDLLDTIKTRSKKRKDLNKVTGKIVNVNNKALADVFAYANQHKSALSVPDYFSAWTESDGVFTIYLPDGNYSLGAAAELDPSKRYKALQDISVKGDMAGLSIVLKDSSLKEVAK